MTLPFPLQASDGQPLAATLYPADQDGPGAVVLVSSATGATQRYYARFATFLATRGLPTVTYDYRGIGDSRPLAPGVSARMQDWGERDLAGAIAGVRRAFPGRRLVLVGHSVGGQLVGLAPNCGEVDAVVLVASQSGHWRLWPAPTRWGMACLWYALVPGITALFGRLPGWLGMGADLPRGVALEWARWCRHRDYLLHEGGEARRAAYSALSAPILAYSFSDDAYAPPAAVEALLATYRSAPRLRRHLTPQDVGRPIGHFGFFRESFQESLWEEVAEWLLARGLGAPLAATPGKAMG
ncbi:MAG: alpha/beta fold hydrolase [Myxococcaceae bacterium]|nr:alpha/beta fold hydrolase [Myxococcaceae bacterium]MCI0668836.1 alpha/beta fold hydrolase [Myxococcaceae bacterium]